MESDHLLNNNNDNNIQYGNINNPEDNQSVSTNKQSSIPNENGVNSQQHMIQNSQLNDLSCQMVIEEKIFNKKQNLTQRERQLFKQQQYSDKFQKSSSNFYLKQVQQSLSRSIERNFEEFMMQNIQVDDYSNSSINSTKIDIQPPVDIYQKQEDIKQELQEEGKQSDLNNQDIPQVDKKTQEEINNLNIQLKDHNCIIRTYLAEGGFGKVFEGTYNEANQTQEVVFKVLYDCPKEEIKNEVDIMKRFVGNTNIIQFIKWIEFEQFDVLLLQKCKFSLRNELKQILEQQQSFSEEKLRKMFISLLDGLIQLRIFKTLHLDIKPDNILITEEGNYLYSDFGISCQFKQGEVDVKGYTRKYAPKEQIDDSKNTDYSSDVYSLGKTFEVITQVYRERNQNNHNSELIVSIENIIQKKMTRDSQNERKDCENLHLQFFEVFINQRETQDFKIEYYKKINNIINTSIFDNNKDIPFILDLILYYLNIQLKLNPSLQNDPKVQFKLYYELTYHYGLISQYHQSLKYCLRSLEISTKFFPGNKINITPLLMLGNLYSRVGDPNVGLLYSIESLEMSTSLFSDNHQNIADSLDNVGKRYNELGDTKNAIKFFLRSVKMRRQLSKGGNLDVARYLNNAGTYYSELGDSKNAMECSLQSLQIYKEVLKGDHPDIATILNNLGTYYSELGDQKNGLEYSLQSLKMYKQLFKGDHLHIAISLSNVGNRYNLLGDSKMALIYSLQSLEMRKQLFKGDHPQIANSLYNVGNIKSELGDSFNGLKYSLSSLEMRKKLFKDDHPHIEQSMNSIQLMYKRLGDSQIASFYSKGDDTKKNLKQEQRQLLKQQYEQEFESSKLEFQQIQQNQPNHIKTSNNEIIKQNVQANDNSNQTIKSGKLDIQSQQSKTSTQVDNKILEEINNLNIKFRDHNYNCIVRTFLAQGGFGKVFEGTLNEANQTQEVVFKILQGCKKEEIQSQIDIMKIFEGNVNIIQFIKWIEFDQLDVLLLQKCNGSLENELLDILNKQQLFSEEKLRQIFISLLDGLVQLRIFQNLHLDINPGNIFITEEGNYVYSDFEISCQFKQGEVDVKGYTRKSPSKEQIDDPINTDYSSDVYLLGKTFEEIIRVYRLRNLDNHNSELIVSIENIIKKKMTRDSQNERKDCKDLHSSFFEAFIKYEESQDFKILYFKKINDIINTSIFDNNKDIPFILDLILYYLNIQLKLNLSLQNSPKDQFQLYYRLAYHYQLNGQYNQSLKFCLRSIEISTELFSGDKLNITPYLMLGNLYSGVGDSDIGLLYSFESLEMSISLFNKDHPFIASSLNNVGMRYSELGDSQNAFKYSLQCLEMTKQLLNGNHPYIATFLHNIATLYSKFGNSNIALKYSLQSFELTKLLFKGDHPEIVKSLNNVGIYYGELGDSKRALKYYLQSLEMAKQIFKGDHPHIANILNNIKLIYIELDDFLMAFQYYKEELKILTIPIIFNEFREL